MKKSLEKNLAVGQKLEAEKEILKKEQNKLDKELLAVEKERMYAENETFLKLFEINDCLLEMEQKRLNFFLLTSPPFPPVLVLWPSITLFTDTETTVSIFGMITTST